MDFLFNNIEGIAVIIFFIISMFGIFNSKRKPSGTEDDEAQPPPVPQRQRTSPRPRPASDLDEEMRRTLEDIFSSKEPNARRADTRTRANVQPQPAKKFVKQAAQVDAEWQRAIQSREAKDAAKAAARAEARAFETEQPYIPYDDQTLLAQARNGIIWSEILQPPVSMRQP